MRLRELIVLEDGEGGATVGATTSADIATVAYPLFVRGATRKQKRKNARAAVGQRYVPGPAYIGQGVFEGVAEGAPIVVAQAPIDIRNPKKAPQPYRNQGDIVPDTKPPSTEKRGVKGRPGQRPMPKHDVEEAHVLNHDNVIYRLDTENPMSDTEVAVLGGAGRYSLKGLRDKARREASALAQDLSIEHGGAFRRSAENIKQLTNTINTIVAAYNELARLRRRGGRGSRGITDEDTNFIRECIRVVEQAAQNYRLMEGAAIEPDATGYQDVKLTNPKYAVVVDTPSDYDWYKIGNHWHDRKIDPHEFGQEDSDTIMVGYGEADFKNMLAKLDKMGFTYKQIGGTHSQPEIHKGRKE